jgi:hypothetical protein
MDTSASIRRGTRQAWLAILIALLMTGALVALVVSLRAAPPAAQATARMGSTPTCLPCLAHEIEVRWHGAPLTSSDGASSAAKLRDQTTIDRLRR